MKTIIKTLALAAIAAAALTACSVDENSPAQQEGQYKYTFQLCDADGTGTRALLDTNHIAWEATDNIGIYSSAAAGVSNNKYAAVTIGTPCTMNVYSAVALAAGDKVYCYYPYTKYNYDTVDQVRLSIPERQEQDSTTYDADAMPLVSLPYTMTADAAASTSAAVADPIYFCNLGSIIDFNIFTTNSAYAAEKVKSVTFNADQAIAGSFIMDLSKVDYANKSTLAISGYTEKSVTTYADGLALAASKADGTDVYMVVAPGSYTGNVTVTTDVAAYKFNITTASTFNRNSSKTLNVDLAKATRKSNSGIWLRKVLVNESQIGIQWSTTDFTNVDMDRADSCTVTVYTDDNYRNVLFRWTFGAGGRGGTYPAYLAAGKSPSENCFIWNGYNHTPGVIISGLKPSTTYYVSVADWSKQMLTTVNSNITTLASNMVDVTKIAAASAKAGDVIMYEDFSEFHYGGYSPLFLSGYNSDVRTTATVMYDPEGLDPFNDVSKLYNTTPNTHMGLFNTLYKFIPNSRLATWATYVEQNLVGAMCVEAGCLKMGASSCTGDIVTPPLTCLSGTATLKVEFDAAPYVEGSPTSNNDPLTAVVEIFGKDVSIIAKKSGSTTYGKNWVDYTAASNAPTGTKTITISRAPSMAHYSVEISGVPAGARIGVGPKIADKYNNQHRMYLDNLQITLEKYE